MSDEEPTTESDSNPGVALLRQVQPKDLLPRKRRRISAEELPEDLQRRVRFLSEFTSAPREA